MVRRFADVVHVGLEEVGSAPLPARPVAFRWRGERYLIEDVLGHWRERRAWWVGGAEQVLADPEALLPSRRRGPRPAAGPVATAGSGLVPPQRNWAEYLGEEYEVWRVEARRASGAALGVYDLCHDVGAVPDLSTWRLLRLVD